MRKETFIDIIGGSKRLLTLTLVKSKSFEDPSVFLKAPLSSWKRILRTEHNFPSLRSKLASELFRNLLPRSFPSWRSRSAWRRRRSLWRGTRRTCIGRRRLRVLPGRRGWCRWPSSAWPSRQRRWGNWSWGAGCDPGCQVATQTMAAGPVRGLEFGWG